MPDKELEKELRELGDRIEYPPTPDLSRAVRRRLDEVEARERSRSRRFWPTLPSLRWATVAAMLMLAVAVPILSPSLRATVTGWFETGRTASTGQEDKATGAAKGRAQEKPIGEALRPSSGGEIRSLGKDLGFGERITLRKAGAPILLPRTPKLGKPNEVYAGEGSVALVYRARPGLPSLADSGIGLLLTQLSGSLESTYLAEESLDGTKLEEVRVADERGYWIPDGRGLRSQPGEAERLPGGALLWEREGRALLMRAELSKEEAIRIAESVR
jgi:hypothetical protein